MKAGEMLATISWRKALAFCFTLLTALCSWPGWLAAASMSVATVTIASSTLQSTKEEHKHKAASSNIQRIVSISLIKWFLFVHHITNLAMSGT